MKKYLLVAASSLMLLLSLVPLGGYGGHHIKFTVVNFAYCILTYFLLRNTDDNWDKAKVMAMIALPVLLIYIPIHAINFNETIYALPSSIAHLTGICVGFLLTQTLGSYSSVAILTLFVSASLWVTTSGYVFWSNKSYFGTYTGLVDEKIAPFTLETPEGTTISSASMKGKILVFDFWNTGCGVCFKKFPELQKYHAQYKDSSKVKFFAVNVPLSRDSTGQAAATMENLGYTFPILMAEKKSLTSLFKVSSYPTVIIIDQSRHIIYRGELEGIDSPLHRLTASL